MVDLGRYNGIRVRHRTMCQPSRCSSKGVNTRRCASKDARPQRGGFGGGPCSSKRVDTRRCASKNVGPKRGWIWGQSHIDWRKERGPARMLNLEGGWFV